MLINVTFAGLDEALGGAGGGALGASGRTNAGAAGAAGEPGGVTGPGHSEQTGTSNGYPT